MSNFLVGRTARIGNEGLATSFYNHDRDKDIGPELVKILIECKQSVPDFLQNEMPEDGEIHFDDDTDEGESGDDDGQDGAGDGATWGSANNDNTNAEPENGDWNPRSADDTAWDQ